MEHQPAAEGREPRASSILDALEEQLAILDIIGAHIAAAHLDAAIQRFRLDQRPGAKGDPRNQQRPPKQPRPA